MNGPYEGIVEVVECGRRKANLYLEHDYQLLGIIATNRQASKRVDVAGSQPFIQRRVTYVLGRTDQVEEYEAPDWEPPAAP